MFYFSWYGFNPQKKLQLIAPKIKTAKDISIVIPVKNNQKGIDHFLDDFFKTQVPQLFPLEILLVFDKGCSVNLTKNCSHYPIAVRIICSNGTGPATARNVGWRCANGTWILFTDSDCRPTSSWLKGYIEASNGSLGYAGSVRAYGRDFISRYYERQSTLMPPVSNQSRAVKASSPNYLITANAMVWKNALEKIGGFNEEIKIAAGEDIDLGFRLREIGDLSFAPNSVVLHDFNDGIIGFARRFRRYGKGNRLLAQIYKLNLKPRKFKPRKRSLANYLLAYIQYLAMLWGWYLD
jgi:glycosyltransferase involved in cell wall biosynthesis